MSNSGNPETKTDKKKNRSILWQYVPVVLVIVSIIVLVTGTQAGAILYAIMFPPTVPLPEDVTEIRYTNHSYGVDEWVYTTQDNVCDVAFFYIASGGACNISLVCGDEGAYGGTSVIECNATQDFSQFMMRWTVFIGNRQPSGSTLNVSREIFWGGEIPPSMEDIIDQIEAEQAQNE